MTEHQRLFLAQARSDFAVFGFLRGDSRVPACHALHYLQMATELLGKAYVWKQEQPRNTHRALVSFLRGLSTNRNARERLGFRGRSGQWRQLLRKSIVLAERVEDLAPALAIDGPNPEYPWPRANPEVAPVEHRFDVWSDLEDTAAGRRFLQLLSDLFRVAEQLL